MKVSWKWLNRLIDLDSISPEDLIDRLALIGLEVESVENKQFKYSNEIDIVLDITSTANRSDLLSIVGIAREIALFLNKEIKKENYQISDINFTNSTEHPIFKDYTQSCQSYILGCIDNIEQNESPVWIQDLLYVSGIEVKGNIHDIISFVILETGCPISIINLSYSNNFSSTDIFEVDYPQDNYKFISSTGISYDLDRSVTLPCLKYNDKLVNLSGIINNINNDIQLPTQNFFLQGILFEPSIVRRASKFLGINNLESQRYERGITTLDLEHAYLRALFLINNTLGGKLNCFHYLKKLPYIPREILINTDRISKMLGPLNTINKGQLLTSDTIIKLLKPLGFQIIKIAVQGKTENPNLISDYKIIPPSFRYYDIEREIDVVEEVARIYGFNAFLDIIPRPNNLITFSYRELFIRKMRSKLKILGINELINYSLEGSVKNYNNIYRSNNSAIVIKNPLSSEYRLLRETLLDNIFSNISYNYKQGNGIIEGYEIGRVFKYKDNKYFEESTISGILKGKLFIESWLDNKMPSDWFYGKAIIEQMLSIVNKPFVWEKAVNEKIGKYAKIFHPYKITKITLNGLQVGYFGQLHPNLIKFLEINNYDLYAFEFNLDALIKSYTSKSPLDYQEKYKAYSLYPSIVRDISITVPKLIEKTYIENYIQAITKPLLYKVTFISCYYGDPIPADYKSLSFRLFYRAEDRTLTINEVDFLHNKLYEHLDQIISTYH
uniref:phenylalanyl-tRNA synthetase beta subunit n=1 Tax=Porphyridium aerugineum TaxID=2792 RepID=UPI001FCD2ADE|nr:phenylalanyl-tRNA synthetase beta subunit [Porphyridium aerugineum]UNJ17865.1 phenylalanyl-tRNA synthetase beta subunit [Porphyridium aerugineum]